MFILSEIKDVVRVPPQQLSIPRHIALTDRINMKYSNRVLHNVGLCIRTFDITSASSAIVYQCQDGSYTCQVEFRLVVFKPWIGEVLTGNISASGPDGIRVSLDFFQDVFIPSAWMKENSVFIKDEGLWIWKVVDEEEGETVDMYMDTGETIRCRVESLEFNDTKPCKKTAISQQSQQSTNPSNHSSPSSLQDEGDIKEAPFYLLCSIVDAGLGCATWWE